MKTRSTVRHPELTEEEIQHAAYLLWIEEGRPEGCDLKHWLAARELLLHRHGRDAHTGRASAGPHPATRTDRED